MTDHDSPSRVLQFSLRRLAAAIVFFSLAAAVWSLGIHSLGVWALQVAASGAFISMGIGTLLGSARAGIVVGVVLAVLIALVLLEMLQGIH